MKASEVRRRFPSSFWTLAIYLSLASIGSAQVQSTERIIVQGSDVTPKPQHLHIDYGVRNAEYRQQVLLLTPLGSSHDEVIKFVRKEWQFEKRPLKSYEPFERPLADHFNSFLMWFGHTYKNDFLEQPPHINISNPSAPFTTQQGKSYIEPGFYNRPIWWRRELYVAPYYIFDDRYKLVDVFVRSDEVRPSSW